MAQNVHFYSVKGIKCLFQLTSIFKQVVAQLLGYYFVKSMLRLQVQLLFRERIYREAIRQV